MNAHIVIVRQEFFLNFFNTTRVYGIKRFDTKRKAINYAKKYGYTIHETLPQGIKEYVYND